MTIKTKKRDPAQMDVSLEEIRDMLWQALKKRVGESIDAWICQVYGSYIIFEQESKYYRLAYSILEGEVQFGQDAVEVEKVWVEKMSSQAETDEDFEALLHFETSSDPEGKIWDVTIVEPGFTLNGWYHPDDVLQQAAADGVFEGVDVNLYELPRGAGHVGEEFFPLKSLLVKNKAGWLEDVKYVAGRGLTGTLNFLDSAKSIGKDLLNAMSLKKPAPFGLSYEAIVQAARTVIEGKSVFKALKFRPVDSVDIVTRPAAGGKFVRAVAALNNKPEKEDFMNKKQIWDMIMGARPKLLEGKDFEKISDDELSGIAQMAMKPEDPATVTTPPASAEKPLTQKDIDVFRCGMSLDRTLAASDLPDLAKKRVQKIFQDRVFEQKDLDQAIVDEKDYLSKMSQPASSQADYSQSSVMMPSPVFHVGLGSLEKVQMAVDRTLGLTKEECEGFARMETLDHQPFFREHVGGDKSFYVRSAQDLGDYNSVPAFRGIRDIYTYLTGDAEISGFFQRRNLPGDLKSRMDITSATFTYVLGNSLGRRLVKTYREANYLEDLLISVRKPVKDFRIQEAVLVGGFSDLDDVDPETGDYPEISAITDEEATYAIAQKGNLLTITRKMIINDDISIINRMINNLGRVARRTHGKYVWNFYVANANCTDGTAVFTEGHANLGAAALSHATALVAWKALAAMTEKDSGEYLGLLDGANVVVNLIGPPALKDSITKIEKEESYYSSNDLTTKVPNPLVGMVKGHTLSLLAGDADDWYMTLPPDVAELVEMGYLNGRAEPEFFVADSPQSEQVFVADKIRHKVRHEYAGSALDYRGGYKGSV